eukprot:754408-Hanusia_phi.AAC.4
MGRRHRAHGVGPSAACEHPRVQREDGGANVQSFLSLLRPPAALVPPARLQPRGSLQLRRSCLRIRLLAVEAGGGDGKMS